MGLREDCERRVYRLAVLLTGSPVAGAAVIDAVLNAQPDLRRLDRAHLDRLTILRSREQRSGQLVDDQLGTDITAALAHLPSQQREAWLLTHVFQLAPRMAARAMDCSVTALGHHLGQADPAMAMAIDSKLAVQQLRAFLSELEPPEFYRIKRRQRDRQRRTLVALGVAGGILAVVFVVRWVLELAG